MPQEVVVDGATYVFPDEATDAQISRALKKMIPPPSGPTLRAPEAEARATTERSAAMGGEFPSEGEVILAEQAALERAEEAKLERQAGRPPGILPETRDEVADVRRRIEEGRALTSPGGAPEGSFFEERESTSIPFLRPTRIEEVSRPAPMVDAPSVRGIRVPAPPLTEFVEGGETVLRPPTETEELIESFARQPVLTREAGRALAAGARPEDVQKRVGEMEGAVIETPFQAVFRAAPASVEALATEAYRRLPVVGEEPVTNLYTRYLKGLSEALPKVQDRGAGPGSELRPTATSRELSAIPTPGLEVLRKLAPVPGKIAEGIEAVGAALTAPPTLPSGPGISATSRELSAIQPKLPQPVIPAPAAISDKPVSQRVREGETLADVIRADPESVRIYNREYGALAPLAIEAVGLGLSAPLPFSPIGVGVDIARVTGATGAVAKAATGALTARAVARAEKEMATKIFTDATQKELEATIRSRIKPEDVPEGVSIDDAVRELTKLHSFGDVDRVPARITLDSVVQEITKYKTIQKMMRGELPKDPKQAIELGQQAKDVQEARGLAEAAVATAKRDLAKITPRTDLVRVSPSYAVPKALAPRVVREAAADVALLRKQAQERGRTLTRAEETAARDAAVKRAAQVEAKRLDELGQFQVLLDGLDTPRVWDTEFFRALRAYQNPEEAMKRASVSAAEQVVQRKGMEALRTFRKEVEAGRKEGKSLNDIIGDIAKREFPKGESAELVDKVLEEAYGPRARGIPRDLIAFDGFELIRPGIARELHKQLVERGAIPKSWVEPDFAANAAKILIEEGAKKRAGKQALADYARQYPDSPIPFMALRDPQGRIQGIGPLSAEATLAERKFFDNGAEDLFQMVDSIPTRAQNLQGTGFFEAAERASALSRSLQAKVRIPFVAKAQLLAGEAFSAPIRAFLTTRYPNLVHGTELVGISTPYGYLRPTDLDRMIDDLGGFGPSRMDIARKGQLVQDILYSATNKGPWSGVWSSKEAKANALKDFMLGRPAAYAAAEGIEMGYRRAAFAEALQRGQTPEAAMELARRNQFDYGLRDDFGVVQVLGPYWAGMISGVAAGTEFVDRVAKNPRNYATYLRALREQQRRQDPTGEMGDAPLRKALVPMTDEQSQKMFGRPLDILGPNAPGLEPLDAIIGLAQSAAFVGGTTEILMDEGLSALAREALGGSVEAMGAFSERLALASAGFGGEPPSESVATRRRALGPASVDQTYMATLALAKSLDPAGYLGIWEGTKRFLAPDFQKPPKEFALPGDPERWLVRPPDAPDVYVIPSTTKGADGKPVQTYYLMKPTKQGRQNLRTLASAPYIGSLAERAITAAGTAKEQGAGEGVLWLLGAETVEEPTARAVEQVRPRSP